MVKDSFWLRLNINDILKLMPKFLSHLFYPQESNNHRPKILHLTSLFAVTFLLLFSTFALSTIKKENPTVLGASTDISFQDLLILTNEQRVESDIPPLTLNAQLSAAADAKAKDMFTKDYWAHNSPDGKTPWDFIKAAGYDYVYAGENLARGFTSSTDVINAWMASPEHRANMLSRNFADVGFAVEEGNLSGEDTTLIVEELGGKKIITAAGNPTILSTNTRNTPNNVSTGNAASGSLDLKTAINSFSLSKNLIEIILGIFILTFILDLIVVERKKITRFTGHNLDHIFFLVIVLFCVVIFGKGLIL